MILVTGGSGFIGSHTVRALHGLGEASVVMQRRSGQVPAYLADLPVVAEQADVADLDSLRAIGERHEITGIVHLAGYPAPRGTVGGIEATQGLLDGLLNIARVAAEWGVRRVSLASTIGVYGGIQHTGPLTEDLPVLLTAPHPIPRSKKIAELLGEQLAEATGTEIVSLRISGTWGPLGHEDPFFAAPALIHAAASGKPLDLSGLLIPPHMGDGLDLCYVKDTGRAIALAQTRRAPSVPHLQRRVRPGDHQRGGDRSDPRSRTRGRARPAAGCRPARCRSRHHPAPPGHRVRARVRHRTRSRRLHRLAQGRQRTLTRTGGSPATTPTSSAQTPAFPCGTAPVLAASTDDSRRAAGLAGRPPAGPVGQVRVPHKPLLLPLGRSEGTAPGRPLLPPTGHGWRRFSSVYPAKRASAGTNKLAFTVPHPVASL